MCVAIDISRYNEKFFRESLGELCIMTCAPFSRLRDSRPRAPSLALRAIHLVPQGGTKKVRLFMHSCLPLGEGAERSEAEGGSKSIAIKYRSSQ